MQAAELFEQQIKPSEVAGRLRVKLAYQWHQVWRDGGCSGPGLPRAERVAVPSVPAVSGEAGRVSGEGPAAYGWVEDQVWTASRVATLIGRKFRVTYSVSGTTRLMHRLGFSPQVPARRVAERDEQAVAAWKEATWAEVKGRGRPAWAVSVSRTKPASPAGRPGDGPGVGEE
ncbi:winged helix-turn-helix domain-containing protein [Streptomyces sp. NPDC060333]|uniref:winged helix-turn-helix domain-containing protein n=1 Tax=Streptomyces sp. NPDC060333 TaxID=3347098 RepID=UPI0036687E0F